MYSFFVRIHVDRFSDLALVIGRHKMISEPVSMGKDNTIDVCIVGDSETARRLDSSLQGIQHILSSAPVVEEV